MSESNPWVSIIGACYSVRSMARVLGWTEAEVVDAGNDRRLLMLRADDGALLLPAFQLKDGSVVDGLSEALDVLHDGIDDPWTWAQLLNTELPEEDLPRSIEMLYDGRLNEVLRDAREDARAWSS